MKGDGRIQIKVQYMCGRMNLDLELLLESRFPDVDIVTDEIVGKPDYIITTYKMDTSGWRNHLYIAGFVL